ncbi:MAG: hypothetical protein ACREBH_04120 [Candidatus Micrarchaeaceae archaeon]
MHQRRAQASIDLLIAYGVAILIISVAMYVVLQLGIFNTRIAPTYCNAAPSFICSTAAMAPNGTLTILFSQATSGTMNVIGISCSNQPNTTSLGPEYGNWKMLPYDDAPSFYPTNQLQNGLTVYSSNQTRIYTYCYDGPNNNLATGALGNEFTGYVWINYTISTLPSNYYNVQQLISFSAKYT